MIGVAWRMGGLLISSDVAELVENCDNVVVLRDRAISEQLNDPEVTEHQLLAALCTGCCRPGRGLAPHSHQGVDKITLFGPVRPPACCRRRGPDRTGAHMTELVEVTGRRSALVMRPAKEGA